MTNALKTSHLVALNKSIFSYHYSWNWSHWPRVRREKKRFKASENVFCAGAHLGLVTLTEVGIKMGNTLDFPWAYALVTLNKAEHLHFRFTRGLETETCTRESTWSDSFITTKSDQRINIGLILATFYRSRSSSWKFYIAGCFAFGDFKLSHASLGDHVSILDKCSEHCVLFPVAWHLEMTGRTSVMCKWGRRGPARSLQEAFLQAEIKNGSFGKDSEHIMRKSASRDTRVISNQTNVDKLSIISMCQGLSV